MSDSWMSDARKIPDEMMAHIRRLAIRAIVEEGNNPQLVSNILNVSLSSVYEWLRRYRRDGAEALETGQAPGAPPTITPRMDRWLKRTVLASLPTDYGYDTYLWTLKILASLLEREFGVCVAQSTVANHLHGMGLSCQTPRYLARGRDPHEIAYYLEKKWASIQNLAEKMGADIAFEDEAGIAILTRSGRTWGTVGSTPDVPGTDKHGGYNALSAVTIDGQLYYRITGDRVDGASYVDFLRMILRERQRPLIVVADHATIHNSKLVRDFDRSHRRQIRLFFLPRHAPEYNPAEQIWNTIKCQRLGKQPLFAKEDLRQRLLMEFRALRMNSAKIVSFFRLKDTKYISSDAGGLSLCGY